MLGSKLSHEPAASRELPTPSPSPHMLFTVRDLISDAPPLVTVTMGDNAAEARRHMIQNDYSQLPVVDEHGKSRGSAVTFRSILNALHSLETTIDKLTVDDVLTPAREVRIDGDLLTVLDDIQAESFLTNSG